MTDKNKNQKKYYSDLNPKPNFPKMELDVLKFWESEGIFNQSVNNRSDQNEYVFYDGPPFANGLPHLDIC